MLESESKLSPSQIQEVIAVIASKGVGFALPTKEVVVRWLKEAGKYALATLVGALSEEAFKALFFRK